VSTASSAGTHIKSGSSRFNTGKQHVNSGSMQVNSGTQIKSGSSRFNTGKQHVTSGSVQVNSGTQIKSCSSRFNTGKQNINSGSVHVNTARVNRPVLNQTSNKTSPKHSQVNLKSPKKCFSKQRSPVNRPFSRNTAHKSNKYAVKGKMGTAVKTSAGCVWRKEIPLSNTNSGPTPDSNVNVSRGPQGRPKPVKAWSKRVVHADVRQATPAWTNTNRVNKANHFTPRPVQLSNIRSNLSTASKTIKSGRVNVNTGHGHVNTGKQHVTSGTQFKSGTSRFNTGRQHVNSGSVHVNSARVNRPVLNNTSPNPSQVNLQSPKKCFSKQRSPVNRPFSRYTTYKSNKYVVKDKMGTAVKTSAGCVWRKTTPLSNTNGGPTPDSNVHVSRGPQGRPKPVKAWVPKRN
ncbi:hypothetical protein Tco_1529459, partial [Tanacetum coccineum]